MLWLIPLRDAADDGASLRRAVVELELEQLLHLGHTLTFQHGGYTDVEFGEVVESHGFLHGSHFSIGSLVRLDGGFEFIGLELDGVILNL